MFDFKKSLNELQLTESIINNNYNVIIGSKYLKNSFIYILKNYYLYLKNNEDDRYKKILSLIINLENVKNPNCIKEAILFDLKMTYLTNILNYNTTETFLIKEEALKKNIIKERKKYISIENVAN